MRKVKIVCTIGPATESREKIVELIGAGMNVARINFSHGDRHSNGPRIELLKQIRDEMGVPLGILLDTKGPEVRLRSFKGGKQTLVAGQSFVLTSKDELGDNTRASVTYAGLPHDVVSGTRVFLDDGNIELTVERVDGDDIHCRVVNGGEIKDNKGMNFPDIDLSLPYISEKDIDDITYGCEAGVDFIAASFAQCADDINKIRALLNEHGGAQIRIIAKIENRKGVDNAQEIVEAADGIMVARGDLGIEIPLEEVPLVQKKLVELCIKAGKPVITATQMLESMIKNPRPTRAEVNDVANSIMDGTDAVMLSGETAVGQYPVEAVRMMNSVALQVQDSPMPHQDLSVNSITAAVSDACCNIAQSMGAKAIITPTMSGATAIMVSRHRPACPIIACAMCRNAFHRLSLCRGIYPILSSSEETSLDVLIDRGIALTEKYCNLRVGDIVVLSAGVPLALSGATNLIHVYRIGDKTTADAVIEI